MSTETATIEQSATLGVGAAPMPFGAGHASRAARWGRLWAGLGVEDRRAAALDYLRDAERSPAAAQSAVLFLAAELKTRAKTVARWPLERRAARLAVVRDLPAPHTEAFLTVFHRRRRSALLGRFLEVAGVAHEDGLLSRSLGEPVDVERLGLAVRTIESEFPAEQVALYIDALELQQVAALRALPDARRRASGAATPTDENEATGRPQDHEGGGA